MSNLKTLAVAVVVAVAAVGVWAQPQSATYHLVGTIPIGGAGGWDYLTADAGAHRLYVSHADRVVVVDTEKNAIVGEIPGTAGVHGIAIATALGRGYTSNGRADTVTVFDLKTLAVLGTIAVTGKNPDCIVFEPVSGRVFTFNGHSGNATAIDAAEGKVVGTLALDGKPEFAVADGRGKVFVNIEDKSEVVEFDARALKIEKRWSLAPGEEPSGLAIDREHRRLFSGCHNRLMVISDADQGRVIATAPIGSGVDGVAFDPERSLAFSSNGEGTLSVIREESPEKFAHLGDVPTKRGARTIGLDAVTHRVYTATATFGPPPPASAEHPHPRPSIVTGTFEVLVLGP
jgi:DNA-binding beta-propeller fold protein YncE